MRSRGPEEGYIREITFEARRQEMEAVGKAVEPVFIEIVDERMPIFTSGQTRHASETDDKRGADVLVFLISDGDEDPLPIAIDFTVAGGKDTIERKMDDFKRHPFLEGIHDDDGQLVDKAIIPKTIVGSNGCREQLIQIGKDRLKGINKSYQEYLSPQELAKFCEFTYNAMRISI